MRRVIVQSYAAWANSMTGGPVKTEDDPFEPDPPKAVRATQEAIKYVERAVASCALEGVALRYGSLYGPGATDLMVQAARHRCAAGYTHPVSRVDSGLSAGD